MTADAFAVSSIGACVPVVEGFPRPDWAAIERLIGSASEAELDARWCGAARTWLELTARRLGLPYRVTETPHFLILTPLDGRTAVLIERFAERAWKQIVTELDGLAGADGYGKHVVLLFATQDTYYEYSSYFYPEGEHPLSAGVFLNADYGHVAIPFYDVAETEATLAHELTHCHLSSWPIPLWLNEGLAVTFENEICGNRPLRLEPERLAEHHEFWNDVTIQEFWSGRSFGRIDEGNELSYELARYCVRALAHDKEPFVEFVRRATFADAGEAAAAAVFGGGLGGLIEQFFGRGDWAPRLGSEGLVANGPAARGGAVVRSPR